MSVLLGIALKSLLIAALALGLLKLMTKRSAAERSWVAHIGLLALIVVAVAPVILPSWNVEAPALFQRTSTPVTSSTVPIAVTVATPAPIAPTVKSSGVHSAPPLSSVSPAQAAIALYAMPAAALLFTTFLALARLVALHARAEVLVDGHWLSALARAQRRMGFKHGTALLTSDDLASPISWGLIRPVILLNSRAVEASAEAEAIIAHELAHVARMDWIKLLLARIATALFWFNPLVWLLAREAHQLREEAADDSVLAADIVDTDYAQLLVGVARHECPGLLLGAHGVAPSKSSLARRVARVLDGKSVRGPVAGSFAIGVFAGALLVAAPLAALNLTPAEPRSPKASATRLAASGPISTYYPQTREVPADLPHIIAQGVSTSVATAVAAVAPAVSRTQPDVHIASADGATVDTRNGTTFVRGSDGAILKTRGGTTVMRGADGASVTVYPPDAQGRRKVVTRSTSGAVSVSYANADEAQRVRDRAIDSVIEAKAIGITPEYIAAMRASAPRLGNLDFNEFSGLRAVGVTPEFARGLVAAGFPSISADELMQARSVGLTGDYVSAMHAAGIRGDIDDFIQLRAVGVEPSFAARVRASGIRVNSADDLVRLRALDIAHVPTPPHPPAPPAPLSRRSSDSDDGG
jgi:beta-lactamase regulating signal transducer with metallopeptidase domain